MGRASVWLITPRPKPGSSAFLPVTQGEPLVELGGETQRPYKNHVTAQNLKLWGHFPSKPFPGRQQAEGLGRGGPIFHSSCEGELGIALESMQDKKDLI